MSIRSPYETFNVFDTSVQDELNKRRKSANLLEVRTPFLRYTTTVEIPRDFSAWYAQLDNATNAKLYTDPFYLERYTGCKFFTVGIHGWNNEKYNDSDVYGMQANSGAVVGIMYKENQQILIRTNGGDAKPASMGERYESPQGYPPPGIESAVVERLRNGNVLKFTVNFVCHTQQQLQMLDMLAFSPGMTCVLEWGNIINSPYGTKGIDPESILDFTKVEYTENELHRLLNLTKGGIRRNNVNNGARTQFIEQYCKPNNYHYDFAIAHVANVKTRLQNNKYRISVTAYGVADNIMYISAYATNNPDFAQGDKIDKTQVDTLITSVREYFAPANKFTVLLDRLVKEGARESEVVKFDEPDDAEYRKGYDAAQGSGTSTNDLGQEQTFYITLNKFIKFFLNDPVDGIAPIINSAVKITSTMSPDSNYNDSIKILEDLTDPDAGDIQVGYNKELRSTDPSTVLIANGSALRTLDGQKLNLIRTQLKLNTNDLARTSLALTKIIENPLTQISPDGNPSGVASSVKGIWLNSKMIQSVFMEARTIHEAIEAMLRRINAATEGYWDLSLTYDEETNNFRIIDNNLKILPKSASDVVYVFNKRLPNNPSVSEEINGSEVLDLQVNADYPKLLASQLAISALARSSGIPNRTDLQYARNPAMGPRLPDILRREIKEDKETKKEEPPPAKDVALNKFVEELLSKGSLYDITNTSGDIKRQLSNAQFDKLPTGVRQGLQRVFSIQRPLSPSEAQGFAAQISVDNLTDPQINAIKTALGLRAKAMVIKAKTAERNAFSSIAGPSLRIKSKEAGRAAAVNEVLKNIDKSKEDLINYINSKTAPIGSTQEQINRQNFQQRTNERGFAGGRPGAG